MLSMILSNWIAIIILMTATWILYLWRKNPAIIDVMWSVAIMISGINYLSETVRSDAQAIFSIILLIWGIRLAAYLLFTRVLPGKIDQRYINLSAQWKIKKSLGFFLNYQLQGVLAMVIALPFIFISQLMDVTVWMIPSVVIILLSIVGEVIADRQLQAFKRRHPGKVCNVGLWKLSRHPNYFFEWLIWVGFALAALPVNYGWISFLSPLLLLFLMLKVTGPMTEEGSIKSRGDAFLEYQKATPMFFPWFSKRS